ncbi:hypothetical protein DDZ16_09605 [Marinilabilia rubra]|uniref:Uncharacterized protein n=2 Tax=Marinilabilia rubra TaxID=2162893 RepID=A0A2U2B9E6_9BACT|nr:hypothetical protein DDZ16_09605 [Marinilabilia rubra]
MLLLCACDDKRVANYESFLIEVESIFLPEDITVNEPFDIVFSGTIGINGCYRFSHFETEREGNDIVVETWGELNTSDDVCADVMVYLDNEALSCQIHEKGDYTLKVKLPDGSFLKKQFTVQ